MSQPAYLKKMTPIEIELRPRTSPSLGELIRFLHVTDCNLALDEWKFSWSMCPVCGATPDKDGIIRHRDTRAKI